MTGVITLSVSKGVVFYIKTTQLFYTPSDTRIFILVTLPAVHNLRSGAIIIEILE